MTIQKNDLEKICRPLLTCICNYWQFINAGNAPTQEQFLNQIKFLLEQSKEAAMKSPTLEKEFIRIERPLIFFIDYMVKEGDFPFSHEWRELARNYNELSGDEKFFDLLSESLDDPDCDKSLEIFYTMLGLGFDGIYRSSPEYIERRMKVCASRFSQEKFDVSSEVLTPITKNTTPTLVKKVPFYKTVYFALIASFVFLLVSFGVNFSSFLTATETYRKALFTATENSVPKTVRNIRAIERNSRSDISKAQE